MTSGSQFPNADTLMTNNATYDHDGSADVNPDRRLAVVTCMDSRIDVFAMLGLHIGEAHVIRNAGGVITDDVIRSLCLSQRYLGTREIMVIHHTDCGLQKVDEASFRAELTEELGVTPPWALEAFDDVDADVRNSMNRIANSPFLTHKDHVRGFVFDVASGRLNEVS